MSDYLNSYSNINNQWFPPLQYDASANLGWNMNWNANLPNNFLDYNSYSTNLSFPSFSGYGNYTSGSTETSSKKNFFKTTNDSEINMTASEKHAIREGRINRLENEAKKSRASFLGMVGMGSIFVSVPIVRSAQVNKNAEVTKMFFKEGTTSGTAMHQQLFNKAPLTMKEAQEEMAKANRRYQRALKKATKKGLKATNTLTSDYNAMKNMMNEALNSGNADEVAQASARLRAANKAKYRFNSKGSVTRKLRIANSADVSSVKAIKGNGFMKHLGGGFGAIMGLVGAGLTVVTDFSKIKEANQYGGKEARNKQIAQTASKAGTTLLAYTVGDTLARKGITKLISKCAGKLAAKIAAKGAGKAIGMAIGSFVPGLGTIAGLLIGAGIDVLLNNVIIPKCFGEADSVEYAKNDNMSKEELLADAYITKANGGEISEIEMKMLQKNPAFCAKMEKQLAEQQAIQNQGVMA